MRLGSRVIRVAWHHTTPGGPSAPHHGLFIGGGPSRPYSVHVLFEAAISHPPVSERMVHGLFAPFGEVTAVILPPGRSVVSRDGLSCRGYGFVHFSGTPAGRRCAMEAIQSLNGQVVNGVRFNTCFSKKTTGDRRPSSGAFPVRPRGSSVHMDC